METPSSIRFPGALRDRVRAQARRERRTLSGMVLRLVEVALDYGNDREGLASIEPDEVERLAALYHETVRGSS